MKRRPIPKSVEHGTRYWSGKFLFRPILGEKFTEVRRRNWDVKSLQSTPTTLLGLFNGVAVHVARTSRMALGSRFAFVEELAGMDVRFPDECGCSREFGCGTETRCHTKLRSYRR